MVNNPLISLNLFIRLVGDFLGIRCYGIHHHVANHHLGNMFGTFFQAPEAADLRK